VNVTSVFGGRELKGVQSRHPTEASALDAIRRGGYESLQPAFVFDPKCAAPMIEQLPPSYEFGPFLVDAGKRLLFRNGEPVPLAPKVLETLLVLIENRERVLSKKTSCSSRSGVTRLLKRVGSPETSPCCGKRLERSRRITSTS
jgi:hypothetical protein